MSIKNELQEIYDALDSKKFGHFPGINGEVVYIEPDAEAVAKIGTAEFLVELLNLRKPIGYHPKDQIQSAFYSGWDYAMNSGQCCVWGSTMDSEDSYDEEN